MLVFFDDILVYSRSIEEQQEHLQQVMEVLKQLYANRKKSLFGQTSLEYLDHIICKDGVAIDQ